MSEIKGQTETLFASFLNRFERANIDLEHIANTIQHKLLRIHQYGIDGRDIETADKGQEIVESTVVERLNMCLTVMEKASAKLGLAANSLKEIV